jgi:hypothetical protein
MTTPMPPTPFDTGNELLAAGPANLFASLMEIPGTGQVLMLTIRTPSATVTVALNQDSGRAWADQIRGEAGKMSAAGLIVAGNGQVPRG